MHPTPISFSVGRRSTLLSPTSHPILFWHLAAIRKTSSTSKGCFSRHLRSWRDDFTLTLSMGFKKGRVRSQSQTGKPYITEWRSGVGRSLRRPRRLLARCAPFVAGVARTGGGDGDNGQRRACLCSERSRRVGRGPGGSRRSRAATALAWELGASCRVPVPKGKLRMKLLWQAKMVTRTLCLLPRLLWWGIFSRFLWACFGLTRSERSNPIPYL